VKKSVAAIASQWARRKVRQPSDWRPPERRGVGEAVRTSLGLLRVLRRAVPHFVGLSPGLAEVDEVEAAQRFGRFALEQLGVRLSVEGHEQVPRDSGLLFMWNQTSHLDHGILAASLPRAVRSLYNNEVARVPLYGSYLRRQGNFHVDRFDEAQWRASIACAAEAVRAGTCIVVSPEGTRSWDGELLEMKRGAFMLACAAQRPIVCVRVRGAFECLPRTSFAVRPGTVRVRFGPIVEVRGEHPGLEQQVAAALSAA